MNFKKTIYAQYEELSNLNVDTPLHKEKLLRYLINEFFKEENIKDTEIDTSGTTFIGYDPKQIIRQVT